MNVIIRQCLTNELDTLQRIGYETFDETFRSINSPETMDKYLQQAFSMKKLSEELRSTCCKFYFMYLDNELVGYLKINDAPAQSDINDRESMEVERIYVRKEHKGKGLGKVLMDYAFQQAKENKKRYVWLGVWEKNVDAIAFYNKMGFNEAGRRSFRMGDEQQSDLIMKKIINNK
ncbi:MAG: GNAT family N-acetyltransferase [Thermodesulfobacteriota bacterium]|nr:GNAT family N-acetyltransferase [Thermodesulfobacteriota bacterium]